MSIVEELLPGSYAGVPFLVTASSIDGGRKDALKEFPNSDVQSIEDLGKRPRSYSLTAITTSDSFGENYAAKRDDLLRVLEKGGGDVLIHPVDGRINNIVVRSFSLREEFTELGQAVFDIAFALDNSDGRPVISGDTLSVVNSSVVTAIGQVDNYVIGNFEVSNSFPANFTAAVAKANDIANAFEDNTSFLQVSADKIDDFSKELVEFRSNITLLISQPNGLVNSVSRLFATVDDLYSDARSTFDVLERFFNFGDDDAETPIKQTTSGRIERAENQNLLNNLVKSQALLLNYENASQLNFTTINQVDSFARILEDQYQSIVSIVKTKVSDPIALTGAEFDRDTLDSITDARSNVQSFFNEQKLNASQIVNIKTVVLPARVISYNYYGSSTVGFNIAELNEDANVSFIEGDIEIFTQ